MNKLWNKDFFLLWQGQLVSQLGNQAFAIASAFYVKHATDSATLMGLVMMVSAIPAVLLGPFAGTFADLHSRKKIIVICDLINGILVLSLAAFTRFASESMVIPVLFTVTFLVSAINSFFRPAVSASIPDLVSPDSVAAANSMNESSVQIATFIGQGIGGVFFRIFGAPVLFLIDGLSYLFSSFSEIFMTIPQNIPQMKGSFREITDHFICETKEGVVFVFKNTGMRNLFLIAAVLNFFLIPVLVLLPFYVEDFLKQTPDWYGFLMAGFGAGSVIGYLLAGTIQLSGKVRSFTIIALIMMNSALMGVLGLIFSPISAVLLMVIAGVMNGFINISIVTSLQIAAPGSVRGRVFGLLTTMSSGITPLSMGLSGVVADLTGRNIPVIYICCGIIAAVFSLLLGLDQKTREFLY